MEITKKMVQSVLMNPEFKQRKEKALEELVMQDCKNYKPCILPLITGDVLFKDIPDAVEAIHRILEKEGISMSEFVKKHTYVSNDVELAENSIIITDVINVSRDILVQYKRADSDYNYVATISFDAVGW